MAYVWKLIEKRWVEIKKMSTFMYVRVEILCSPREQIHPWLHYANLVHNTLPRHWKQQVLLIHTSGKALSPQSNSFYGV